MPDCCNCGKNAVVGRMVRIVECSIFPIDDDDCRSCKNFLCSVSKIHEVRKNTDKILKDLIEYYGKLGCWTWDIHADGQDITDIHIQPGVVDKEFNLLSLDDRLKMFDDILDFE